MPKKPPKELTTVGLAHALRENLRHGSACELDPLAEIVRVAPPLRLDVEDVLAEMRDVLWGSPIRVSFVLRDGRRMSLYICEERRS